MEACKSEIYSETYPLLLLNRIKRCWRSSLHLIKCRYKLELNSRTLLLFNLFFLLMFWLCYLSVIKKFYDVKSVMMWVFYACACSHTLICSQTLTLDHFLSCFFLNLIFVFYCYYCYWSWSSLIWLGCLTRKSHLSTHLWLSTDGIRYMSSWQALYIGDGDPNFGPHVLMSQWVLFLNGSWFTSYTL